MVIAYGSVFQPGLRGFRRQWYPRVPRTAGAQ